MYKDETDLKNISRLKHGSQNFEKYIEINGRKYYLLSANNRSVRLFIKNAMESITLQSRTPKSKKTQSETALSKKSQLEATQSIKTQLEASQSIKQQSVKETDDIPKISENIYKNRTILNGRSYCKSCGKDNDPDARFCNACGLEMTK